MPETQKAYSEDSVCAFGVNSRSYTSGILLCRFAVLFLMTIVSRTDENAKKQVRYCKDIVKIYFLCFKNTYTINDCDFDTLSCVVLLACLSSLSSLSS